jgi:hypothetical protein
MAATVRGVVIAEAGRLGTPRLLAIGDASGGLPVRLAEGQVAPERGTLVELRGIIAAPYGQTELRLVAGGLSIIGHGTFLRPVNAAAVNEGTEGRQSRQRDDHRADQGNERRHRLHFMAWTARRRGSWPTVAGLSHRGCQCQHP